MSEVFYTLSHILGCLRRRLTCAVYSHEWAENRVYHWGLRVMTDVYECERCGCRKAYSQRQQEVADDE